MDHRPIHFHSMLVHTVIALAPLAAASFLLYAANATLVSIGPEVWRLLLWFSLVGILAVSIPATLTGISERNHLYANWLPSHRYKLALSLLLAVLVAVELIAMVLTSSTSRPLWLALAIVVGNCTLVVALSYFGLRITLGRQALAPTSYTPDMDLKPAADILASVADYAVEAPKLIDVREDTIG